MAGFWWYDYFTAGPCDSSKLGESYRLNGHTELLVNRKESHGNEFEDRKFGRNCLRLPWGWVRGSLNKIGGITSSVVLQGIQIEVSRHVCFVITSKPTYVLISLA